MKSPSKGDNIGIWIGARPETIEAARNVVVEILNSPAGTKEKVAAFAALKDICSVNGANLAHNTVLFNSDIS